MNKIILGTQLFGSELNEKESLLLLDYAFKNKILKIDSAERYPFPEKNSTYGITEKIIGKWLVSRKIQRTNIEIATKITGRNTGNISKVYSKRLTKKAIKIATERSLARLKTDYIDIIYLHWPDRYTNNFGRHFYNPDRDDLYIPLENQYEALKELHEEGKIKSFGLSNESSWGLMKFASIDSGANIFSTIQEEYSILNRNPERSFKEIVIRENKKFYCYSPFSGGLLTKNYTFNKNNIKNVNKLWRLTKYKKETKKLQTESKIKEFKELKKKCKMNRISLLDLSLHFLKNQKFVSGIVIGPRNIQQLEGIIRSYKKTINNKVINKIKEITEK